MTIERRSAPVRIVLGIVIVCFGVSLATAQSPAGPQSAPPLEKRTAAMRPEPFDLSTIAPAHPLKSVLEYAAQEQAYLRQTVRDFSCRLVKRERIDDYLQDYNYINMWAREEVREGGRVVSPLSIYLEFLAPAKVAGRRVLFVDGQNDGKILVRNGGKHFDYVVAKIDPYGDSAMDESLVPITKIGFNQLLDQMIAVLGRHAAADPSGQNTQVERIAGAKLDKRPCHVIRITHPLQQKGLEFHVVNVFVDDELHVPVRVDYSDWPARADQPAPLIAEYTYTQLKVNVGLSQGMFNQRQLRAKRSESLGR